MKPSHNFQLNRTAHGGAGASGNRPKSTFSKNGPWATFCDFCQKVTILGTFFDQKRKFLLRFLSQLILTICVHFQQFVWNFNFFDPKSTLLRTFFLSRCLSFLAIWRSLFGHFQNCSFESVHKSPEAPRIRVLLRKMWIRRLSTREHPKVPKNAFSGAARKMVKNHRVLP